MMADDDAPEVLRFLQRDRLINVYLISRILEERFPSTAQLVQVRFNGELVMIGSLSTNIVLAGDPTLDEDLTEAAIAVLAERILTRMLPVRAIISPAYLVESLWLRLRMRIDPPTVVRLNQPIYALERDTPTADLKEARYATMSDLAQLVPACAAMHTEEVGIDPLERDATGYRERVRELIERRRSIVLVIGGQIASKCEFSAVTPDTVQLMGVWTAPELRRQGLSRKILEEVCGHLRKSGKSVTLFVNDFNAPAIALYESLGFERIGVNRALIW